MAGYPNFDLDGMVDQSKTDYEPSRISEMIYTKSTISSRCIFPKFMKEITHLRMLKI